MSNMSPGKDVYTADNDKVGQVKEVRGGYFKVNSMGQPDYWLETDCCASGYAGGDVHLIFTKDKLGEHKIDESRVKAA